MVSNNEVMAQISTLQENYEVKHASLKADLASLKEEIKVTFVDFLARSGSTSTTTIVEATAPWDLLPPPPT